MASMPSTASKSGRYFQSGLDWRDILFSVRARTDGNFYYQSAALDLDSIYNQQRYLWSASTRTENKMWRQSGQN